MSTIAEEIKKLTDAQSSGPSVTIESLSVDTNRTYTAPDGTAYDRIIVNVKSDALSFPVLKEKMVQSISAFYDESEVDMIKESSPVSNIAYDPAYFLAHLDKIYTTVAASYVPLQYKTFTAWLKMMRVDTDSDMDCDFYYMLFFMDVMARLSPIELYLAMSGNVNTSMTGITALIPHDDTTIDFATQLATMFYWLFVLWVYGNGTDIGLNDTGIQELISDSDFTNQGVLVFSEMATRLNGSVDQTKFQTALNTEIAQKDVAAFLCFLKLIQYNAYTCFNNYLEFNNTDLTDAIDGVMS